MTREPIERDSTKDFEKLLLGRLEKVPGITRVSVSYVDLHPGASGAFKNHVRAIVTVELDGNGLGAEVIGATARLARDCDLVLNVMEFTNGGGVIFSKPTLLDTLTNGPKYWSAATTMLGSVMNFVLNHQKDWLPFKVVRGEEDPNVPNTWNADVQTNSGKWFRVLGTVGSKREIYQVTSFESLDSPKSPRTVDAVEKEMAP